MTEREDLEHAAHTAVEATQTATGAVQTATGLVQSATQAASNPGQSVTGAVGATTRAVEQAAGGNPIMRDVTQGIQALTTVVQTVAQVAALARGGGVRLGVWLVLDP